MFVVNVRQGGVTLMESIVCLMLIAGLTVWSAPSITKALTNSLINSERQGLAQDIRLIRRFALTRHRPAYLCAMDAEKKCSKGADWNDGWIGYVDRNYSHSIDEGDEVVMTHHRKRDDQVEIFLHARWQRIKFNSSGVVRSSGHFRICDTRETGVQAMKVIRMNVHGRLSIEQDKLECI